MTRLALSAVLAAVLVVTSRGQELPRFRSGVEAVSVDVRVTRDGEPVAGLTADNFEVRDDGVPQSIQSVVLSNLPLHLLLVLDSSRSVAGRTFQALKDATLAATASLRPDDRVSLLTFSHEVRLLAGPAAVSQAAGLSVTRATPTGSTSLHDAMLNALVLRDADARRPVMVVFTDGEDTSSWLRAAMVREETRRSDVVIYAVSPPPLEAVSTTALDGWFDADPQRARRALLITLTRETGGRMLYADPERDLRAAFLEIVDEFKNRYLLTYTPEGVSPDGWHPIDVRLRGVTGDVLARTGYLR